MSVVIPVHNEAVHLERLVEAFAQTLGDARATVAEVLLIENGSRDGTAEAGQRLAQRYPGWVRVVRIERASYGEALKRGIQVAAAPWTAILECDFLDVGFLQRAREQLRTERALFAVGSKRHAQSADRRPLKRRVLTFVFNRILRVVFGFSGTDTHGLKLIRSDLARFLTGQCQTTDEVFQTELVLLAHRLGYKVVEVPVEIREARPTPFPILKRVPKVLKLVGEIRASLGRFRDAAARERVLTGAPPRA